MIPLPFLGQAFRQLLARLLRRGRRDREEPAECLRIECEHQGVIRAEDHTFMNDWSPQAHPVLAPLPPLYGAHV